MNTIYKKTATDSCGVGEAQHIFSLGDAQHNCSAIAAESETIRLCKLGDHQAFTKLVIPIKSKLQSYIYGIVHNHHDTEDLLQDTFRKAWKNIERFNGKCQFSTWVHSIAYHESLNLIRWRKNKFMLSTDNEDIGIENDSEYIEKTISNSIDSDIIRKETIIEVQKAIEKLPLKFKQLIKWHEFDGRTSDDIAKEIGINPNTVRSRIFYAKKMLASLLENYRTR